MSEDLMNGSGGNSRKMVPVSPEFWEELRDFLEKNSITAMDLKRAGVNYNTARKIVLGTQTADSVNTNYMITLFDLVNDTEK